MSRQEFAVRWYGRALRRSVLGGELPRHIALIMDGNRRWARLQGHENPSVGHRFGAQHLEHVLSWCSDLGIEYVTAWVASADNLAKRSAPEVAFLMDVAAEVIPTCLVRAAGSWQLHLAGNLDLLPTQTAEALRNACAATEGQGAPGHLTIAIGYDGRTEILEAVRTIVADTARSQGTIEDAVGLVTEDRIAAHLYNPGHPDPDLIIRTSGEQRLSDFMLWQGVDSELYFSDAFWPGFRHVDFLSALRDFGGRRASLRSPGTAPTSWRTRRVSRWRARR